MDVMRVRRLVSGVVHSMFVALVGVLVFGLTPGVAGAKTVHVFGSSFGSGPCVVKALEPCEGRFDEPAGVAVNDATGDVYVVDKGNKRVEEFTEKGVFVKSFAPPGGFEDPEWVAVDDSGKFVIEDPSVGDVYVADNGHKAIDKFSETGTYLGQLTGTCPAGGETQAAGECEPATTAVIPFEELYGVAVDPAGELWVYQSNGRIDNFSDVEPNAFLTSRQDRFDTKPGFAVDSEDDLYVGRGGGSFAGFTKLNDEAVELVDEVGGGSENSATAAAVDPATGDDVYVYDAEGAASTIAAYSSAPGCTVSKPCRENPFLERFGAGDLTSGSGLAIDSSDGTVYATDSEDHVVVFTAVAIPDVTTEAVSEPAPASATLNGTVSLDKEGQATCRFEWGTTTSLGQDAQCEPEDVTTEPGPVHAKLTGLTPDTTYYYRLHATNKIGSNEGEILHFTTPGPGLHGESVADVAATSATFEATIDPHGEATSCYFQYGTSGNYSSATDLPAAPGAPVGSGEGDVQAIPEHVQGLAAGTTYHYRVVVVSEVEVSPGVFEAQEFAGPDQTFTTQPAVAPFVLPDARQWEMVSSPNKLGARIFPIGGELWVTHASASGDAMTYLTNAPTEAEPQGYAIYMQVLSTRGPQGWSSRDINPPHEAATGYTLGYGETYQFFSEDLSQGAMQPLGPFTRSLSEEASEQTPFLRTLFAPGDPGASCGGSCYRPLVSGCPAAGECRAGVREHADVPAGTVFGEEGKCPLERLICGPEFVGATPDLTHVVLSSEIALTGTPIGGASLYEWTAGRQLQQVDLLPANGKGEEVPAREAQLGLENSVVRHAISADDSRIVWVVPAGSGGHLYMRDMARGETVQLDAVQGGSGTGGGAPPVFQDASSDGSRVFFTDGQHLTQDSGGTNDLYVCEMVVVADKLRCELTDLTPTGANGPAEVAGLAPGVSEDGSWVYFAASGVLAPGAVQGDCGSEASPGSMCNMYVAHYNGAAWETNVVVVLPIGDINDWSGRGARLRAMTARVSPDGRWLAFMSQRSLTGYDTTDALTGRPDEEVYLYDAGTNRVVCASCNPTGARPVGVEYKSLTPYLDGGLYLGWSEEQGIAASVPAWTSNGEGALYQPRYLSDNGRLFFNSNDALVPQDVNGTGDVYEYEPPGVGGCTTGSVTFSERSDGCVDLISSGSSPEESGFMDASATGGRDAEGHEGGGDVFFFTSARLSPADYDTSRDVYDAHECSAAVPCFAAPAAVPPPCVTGDACKAAPSPEPAIFGAPASATFSGAGNVTGAVSAPVVGSRSLTRAQKLTRALRACRKRRGKRRRVCERAAHRAYATGAAGRRASTNRRGGR